MNLNVFFLLLFLKRESSIDCNLINTHDSEEGDITLLVGSNYNKGLVN